MANGPVRGTGSPQPRQDRRKRKLTGGRTRRSCQLRWSAGLGALVLGLAGAQSAVAVPPDASFSAPSILQIDQAGTFSSTTPATDADGNTIASTEWDFEDNGSFDASGASVQHAYGSAGTKTVRMKVTDSAGESAETTRTLRVNAPPVARFLFSALDLRPGQDHRAPIVGQQSVGFTATSSTDDTPLDTFQWFDAPGGAFGGNTATPVHAPYATAGEKLVVLRVTDRDGVVDEEIGRVRVNTPPVAAIGVDPPTPLTGEPVDLDEAARDPDPLFGDAPNIGGLVKFEWDLDGDATTGPDGFEANGEHHTRTFASPGAKRIRLRATDGGGLRATADVDVVVSNSLPDARFGHAPAFPLPGETVTFTSSSQPTAGKQILSQEWDFDYDSARDGMISAADVDARGGSATHAFSGPGPHRVALKVTEQGGGVDIETAVVVVNSPPKVAFTASPSAPVTGEAVTFASTSEDSDGPLAQAWDTDNDGQFDDGAGAVATRTFGQPGTYKVRLRVEDSMGASAVSEGTVAIAPRGAGAVRGAAVLGMTVNISGRTTQRGARLTRLLIRGPVGTRLTIRCKGKSCPFETRKKVMKRSELRVKRLQKHLRAGTKIVIEGRLDGFVGKKIVYKIRKGKPPKRRELCLPPGGGRSTSCTGP